MGFSLQKAVNGFLDKFTKQTGRSRTVLLFRLGLALIYFIVFLSLLPQALTLIGSKGILPIAGYIEGTPRLHYETFPTLFLFWNSDTAIIVFLLLGIVASVLLFLGIYHRWSLAANMLIFLSFVVAGKDFFSFQWDSLLLEASFLALFLPLQGKLWKPKLTEPSPVLVLLFWWLAFRLYFESGVSKIVYGQGTWLNLSALQYYYETSPLPSFGGWFVQQLFPASFHQVSVFIIFFIEIIVAFLIFSPRKLRIISFYVFAGFNLVIMFTSNYGYFNPLCILVGLFLLDDQHLKRFKLWKDAAVKHTTKSAVAVSLILLIIIIPVSVAEFMPLFGKQATGVVGGIQSAEEPFRLVNSYHLFPGVVQQRIVPVIMGSEDGVAWREYAWKLTPQNISDMLPWLPFYQARFAFQYSFVPLQSDKEYFSNSLEIICQGTADSLLAEKPFDKPKFIRVDFYIYKFSTPEQLFRQGLWWSREYKGSTSVFNC